MDINGLTPQQNGVQPASRAVAPKESPPPTPEKAAGAPAPAPVEADTGRKLQAAVDAITARSQSNVRSGARIHVDKATDRVVVEIVNADNEVIRQLPAEEVLRIAANLEHLTGLIFDQDA